MEARNKREGSLYKYSHQKHKLQALESYFSATVWNPVESDLRAARRSLFLKLHNNL